MNMQADKKYTRAIFVVLNKIKIKLRFDLEQKNIVDYYFDLNIRRQAGNIGFTEERAIIQKLRNEGIIVDLTEADVCATGVPGTPVYKAYELYHFKVSGGFDDYYDKYQKAQAVFDNYCWFDNNTFFITLHDDSVKTISFDTQSKKRQLAAVFQAVIEHWKLAADKPITGKNVVQLMAKYGSEVDVSQLKNIFSNLRNKKIKPAGLENIITIDYDKKAGGWRVNINRQ
jgi:hypothetical protein